LTGGAGAPAKVEIMNCCAGQALQASSRHKTDRTGLASIR
jgi:hypothetical protein